MKMLAPAAYPSLPSRWLESFVRLPRTNLGQPEQIRYGRALPVSQSDAPSPDPVIPRVAAGESRAMNECIARYGNLVWGVVRRFVKDSAAAEDLVQEVFTELWKKAAAFDPSVASEATFVGLVARRRAIDFLRRQGRQPEFEPLAAAESLPAPTATLDSLACDPEAVRSSVATLPEDTRELFQLFFDQGLTHPEIANRTGLPLGTIKTRLRRGLLALRDRLRRGEISKPQLSP